MHVLASSHTQPFLAGDNYLGDNFLSKKELLAKIQAFLEQHTTSDQVRPHGSCGCLLWWWEHSAACFDALSCVPQDDAWRRRLFKEIRLAKHETNKEIKEIKVEIKAEIIEMNREIKEMKAEMKAAEIMEMKAEITEIKQLFKKVLGHVVHSSPVAAEERPPVSTWL